MRAVESCYVYIRLGSGNGEMTANMLEKSLPLSDLTKSFPFQNATQLPLPLERGRDGVSCYSLSTPDLVLVYSLRSILLKLVESTSSLRSKNSIQESFNLAEREGQFFPVQSS